MFDSTDDPDRFHDYQGPGAQEWWYFDAISEDERDVVVLVWYVGLPFDPAYGVAALRSLRDPGRYPAPRSRDHCAIGLSWYRDGKPMAYALNAFRAGDFRHNARPFVLEVEQNRLSRSDGAYRLQIETPGVDGKSLLQADFEFQPAPGTRPLERELGTDSTPHRWILAAADCQVVGSLRLNGRNASDLAFRGRGYHDHNAGAEEISSAMRRWCWGRAHLGSSTLVYYRAEPRSGDPRSLVIHCRDGRQDPIDPSDPVVTSQPARNVFGLQSFRQVAWSDAGVDYRVRARACVDDGPFYQRWLSDFEVVGPLEGAHPRRTLGITEHLDAQALNRPWFNWMIPYRLKRPTSRGFSQEGSNRMSDPEGDFRMTQ